MGIRTIFKASAFLPIAMLSMISCSNYHNDLKGVLVQSSPILSPLAVSVTTNSAITLEKPGFTLEGNPAPSVEAYIGVDGTISVSGSTVSGSVQGPVDVSSSGAVFSGLSIASYRIVVVAKNALGYWTRSITQSTADCSPKLNNLVVNIGSSSITLVKPSFSLAGNPIPAVSAWIGVKGTISVSGETVSGSLQGPVDVTSGNFSFSGLSSGTQYTIVAVAKNSSGYDVKTINAGITGSVPVLLPLSVVNAGVTTVSLDQPSFSTAGSPVTTVKGWIGTGLTVTGNTVSGTIVEAVADVSSGYVFSSGLSPWTDYDIVVIAENSAGYGSQTISVRTAALKKIPYFGFSLPVPVSCMVDDTAHTITGNIPFCYDIDSIAATFTLPASTSLSVGADAQTSGVTKNDFYDSVTTPVVYTATWADGTTQDYDVSISNYGTVSTLSPAVGTGGGLNAPMGMTNDGTALYIANSGYSDILKLSSPDTSPALSLFAGQQGVSGSLDGAALSAQFDGPAGICFDALSSAFYIADSSSGSVRRLALGSVTTTGFIPSSGVSLSDIATDGTDEYVSASDGRIYRGHSSFIKLNPTSILSGCAGVQYYSGNVFVADGNRLVEWQIATSTYSVIAGGTTGFLDGAGATAQFGGIGYMTLDSGAKHMYLSDAANYAIRKVNLVNGRVTTIAGSGAAGSSDGSGVTASFNSPRGITLIGTTLYVADSIDNTIRAIK